MEADWPQLIIGFISGGSICTAIGTAIGYLYKRKVEKLPRTEAIERDQKYLDVIHTFFDLQKKADEADISLDIQLETFVAQRILKNPQDSKLFNEVMEEIKKAPWFIDFMERINALDLAAKTGIRMAMMSSYMAAVATTVELSKQDRAYFAGHSKELFMLLYKDAGEVFNDQGKFKEGMQTFYDHLQQIESSATQATLPT